ncbi:MAG: HtrA protease/chaperone protein [Deltaproteobacteria bacterium]|nr:HtrA protease/chaperone protein [Deltaproteobacteria bacterium]
MKLLFPVIFLGFFLGIEVVTGIPVLCANERIADPSGNADVNNAFVAVVRDVGPSVVSIRAEALVEGLQIQTQEDGLDEKALRQFLEDLFKRRKRIGTREASGIIIREDGLILTNHHVVADATKITVNLYDGTSLEGNVVGSDSRTDLAVIRVRAKDLKVPKFGDSDRVEPGQWAIAIGSPYGFDKSVTIGVISARSRPGLNAVTPAGELIQTDASINPGNSGGPLVNIKGEIIGVNWIVIRPGQGIGFAIPINRVKRVMDDLIKSGRVLRPWLGIGLQELTPEIKKYFGVDLPGAMVRQVVEKGPSDNAGLKPGDIIISVEGEQALNPQYVLNSILDKRIGQIVKVEAIRSGRRFTASITTGDEEKQPAGRVRVTTVDARGPFGLLVKTITPGIAQKLDQPDMEGVIVTAVETGSPAHAASLMIDDVIVHVNGRKIRDEKDYRSAVKRADPEKGTLLMIDRTGSTFFVVLKEENKKP